jgi:hypothetical protein
MPNRTAASIRVAWEESAGAVIRDAPSSSENSVWVWRWTKEPPLNLPITSPRVEKLWKVTPV